MREIENGCDIPQVVLKYEHSNIRKGAAAAFHVLAVHIPLTLWLMLCSVITSIKAKNISSHL